MADVEIPNRALFKASEVCEIAGVQPYVLRSWESEFPDLGVSKSSGGPRVYRRADVERVLHIKQLVVGDGLTLAGVRRRFDEQAPPVLEDADAVPIKELLGRNAKERLASIKRGLVNLLEMLDARPAPSSRLNVREQRLDTPQPPARAKGSAKPSKGKAQLTKGRAQSTNGRAQLKLSYTAGKNGSRAAKRSLPKKRR